MTRAKGPSSYVSLSAKGSAGGGENGAGGGVDEEEDDEDEVEVIDSESSAAARGIIWWTFGRCSRDRASVAEGPREGTAPQRPLLLLLLLLVGTRAEEIVEESISIGKKRGQIKTRLPKRTRF